MPKRSRSESVSVPLSRNTSVEIQPEVADTSPTHAPKYLRSSTSPLNDVPSGLTIDRPMQCILPPHAPITLPSVAAFDSHYAQEHTNRCAECAANLPSPWFLDLHLSEMHDPLVAGLREKGEKTYKCFIPTCERVTSAPKKRRLHLIDKHGYPRNYDFRIVENGIGNRLSLLRGGNANSNARRRRVSEVGDQNWRNGGAGRGDGGRTNWSRRGTLERAPQSENGVNHQEGTSIDEGAAKSQIGGDSLPSDEYNDSAPSGAGSDGRGKGKAKNEDGMDVLMSGMAALKFVPLSVRMKEKSKAS